jgi:hypothetical protein
MMFDCLMERMDLKFFVDVSSLDLEVEGAVERLEKNLESLEKADEVFNIF